VPRRNTGKRSIARRFELGRVLGIPIEVDASWLLVLALVTWTLSRHHFPAELPQLPSAAHWLIGLTAALLLFTCVLLHELGHCVVARMAGIPVSRVTLFIFGGVAHIAHDPRRPLVELRIALAGPLVSAGIALLARTLAAAIPLGGTSSLIGAALLRYLAAVNLVILLFNLLPGFPLDGGRALRSILWASLRDLRLATRIVTLLGSVLGFGLLALGVLVFLRGNGIGGLWYICLGAFLHDAARASYQEVRLRMLWAKGRPSSRR